MRVGNSIQLGDKISQADATFLMRARDVLNARAAPASGLTIAFTSMIAGGPVAEFAERAYPQLRKAARSLARSIAGTTYALPVVLVLALSGTAYTAWGKVALDAIEAARREYRANQQELSTLQSSLPATPNFCDQVNAPAVCDRAHDISIRYAVAAHLLAMWQSPFQRGEVTTEKYGAALEQKQVEQWAIAVVTVLGNYLMPVLYGLIGSITFVLRNYYNRLAAYVLWPRDLRINFIRLWLGVLIGGCIGLVTSSNAAQANGILEEATTMYTSAFALLGGYSVDGLFRALDAVITQVFRVSENDGPRRATA
jgi:hypothetical protein